MAETLEQIKRQLGRDAVILSTRTATAGGLFGIGGKPYVEITAARQMSDLPGALRRGKLKCRSGVSGSAEGAARTVSPASNTVSTRQSDVVLSEVRTLKSLVSDLLRDTRRSRLPNVPEALFDTYQRLVENDVAEQIARQLIERVHSSLSASQLGDPQAVRSKLAGLLESMLPTAGPIRCPSGGKPVTIALIGPTGVGKTTTIAKLAANFCLRQRRRVGLITVDTYRIAAVEQLKTYAEIIDVPLAVAASPEQLEEAVARMADREIILVDTAGRSQRDDGKMKELHEVFHAVRPDEVHLVLSSTASEAVLSETIERFRGFGVDRIVLTKLDEAIGFGVILNCLQMANAALSYVTTGQDVPDDIEVGRGRDLAKLILRERSGKPNAVLVES